MAWTEFDVSTFLAGLDPDLFREERRSAYRISGPLRDVVHAQLFIGTASADADLLNIGVGGAAVRVSAASCGALRRGFQRDGGSAPTRLVVKLQGETTLVNARVEQVGMHPRQEGLTLRFRFVETGSTQPELERRLERHLSRRDAPRVAPSASDPVAVRLSRGPRGARIFGCLRDVSHGGLSVVVSLQDGQTVHAGLTTGVAMAFPTQAEPAQILATIRHVRPEALAGVVGDAAVLGMQFAKRGAARCANRDLVSRYIVQRQLEIRRKWLAG